MTIRYWKTPVHRHRLSGETLLVWLVIILLSNLLNRCSD